MICALPGNEAFAARLGEQLGEPPLPVLGPDSESEQWAAEVARACDAPYAVMNKTRLGDRSVRIDPPALAAWRDRTPVLIDDIISSARTMARPGGGAGDEAYR